MQKICKKLKPCYIKTIMKTLKLQDIAREAKVSISTVSRVINGSTAISPPVRARVLELARESGYLGERRKNRLIIIIVSFIRNFYANYVINELQQLALRENFLLELVLPEQVDLLKDRIIYGAISLDSKPSIVQFWRNEMNSPLVMIDHPAYPLDNVYAINYDEEKAMEIALEQLIKAGHTRIGLFLGAQDIDCYWNRNRIAAFAHQHVRLGLGTPIMELTKRHEDIESTLLRLLDRNITAMIFICMPDMIRFDRFMERQKIRIPQDLSVVIWEMLGFNQFYQADYAVMVHNHAAFAQTALELITAKNQRKHVESCIYLDYICKPGNGIAPPRRT